MLTQRRGGAEEGNGVFGFMRMRDSRLARASMPHRTRTARAARRGSPECLAHRGADRLRDAESLAGLGNGHNLVRITCCDGVRCQDATAVAESSPYRRRARGKAEQRGQVMRSREGNALGRQIGLEVFLRALLRVEGQRAWLVALASARQLNRR